MPILEVISHSEEQTEQLAEKLAPSFGDSAVIVLSGPLGAGKTAFVRGLARGLHLSATVHSPSYTVVNEYKGRSSLFHFDLYRLGDTRELKEIGWDDFLTRPGVVVVEWGEKAESLLPENYFHVTFTVVSEHERAISIAHYDKGGIAT